MNKVSELLAVKIELATIKIQQLQASFQQLVTEQRTLVEQARSEIGASADWVYSLDVRSFQAPVREPVPLSTSADRQAKRAKA